MGSAMQSMHLQPHGALRWWRADHGGRWLTSAPATTRTGTYNCRHRSRLTPLSSVRDDSRGQVIGRRGGVVGRLWSVGAKSTLSEPAPGQSAQGIAGRTRKSA